MNSLQQAIELFRQGRARDAEQVCEKRIARSGGDADALSLLAEIRVATGDHARAAAALTQLIALRPHDAAVHRRLAGAFAALGRAEEAARTLRLAISLDPANARAHNNLAQALLQLGKSPEAKTSYLEALRLDPGYAIAHNNLGLAHMATGEFGPAADCFRRAVALNAEFAAAEINLAAALERLGQTAEALQSYERALARDPQLIDAWLGRGSLLANLNRLDVALQCFDAALRLRPNDAPILVKKALCLLLLERAAQALETADAALRIDSECAEAHNARAGALRRLGRRAEALCSLQRAVSLAPAYAEAWTNYSTILHETGQHAAAAARRALELEPNDIQARTRALARLIPSVPMSSAEATLARTEFDAELERWESWLEGQELSETDVITLSQQQFFYLSYQEASNRSLLERFRSASATRLAHCASISDLGTPVVRPAADVASQRFRLGLVTAHLFDHSVYNAIVRGWLEHLDPARFEITVFRLGSKLDDVTRAASAMIERVESERRTVPDWARSIRGHGLDAVIFPEVGMNETTLALASLRLAHRQFAAWGHPETSGLPTLDGYFSAALFEPHDAQEHYTERLLPLPNLGVHCEPYEIEPALVDLDNLGLAGKGPLFVCPGVPFKYRPEDDRVLVEIARRLSGGTFVFFQHEIAELSEKLHRRIAMAFEAAGLDPKQHLRFIPWLPRAAFFGLLLQADVYLDTIGFSGFNTMMQAVQCHLPCVTHDGRFMRGRLGSGIMRRIGLSECIAVDQENYIRLAVELGTNAKYRAKIRATLSSVKTLAFADVGAVDALAQVLLDSWDRQ